MNFLLPKATFTGDIQGDASGIGFGGLIVVGSVMYYLHGVWTKAEKRFLENGNVLNVNYTEALTQLWVLVLFKEHLRDHTCVLECDNMWAINARQRTVLADALSRCFNYYCCGHYCEADCKTAT
jgi:hypothetical protein